MWWPCGGRDDFLPSIFILLGLARYSKVDRVAQNLEIISKNFQFSTRRTRILMGFSIYYLVLIVNPVGRILVC